MSVSAQVRERCRALLEPGEKIRYLVPADNPMAGSFLIAVTDRRMAVLMTRLRHRDRPNHLHASFPRTTLFGPVDRNWGPFIRLGGWEYEVDEDHIAELAAADAETSGTTPYDPLPDL